MLISVLLRKFIHAPEPVAAAPQPQRGWRRPSVTNALCTRPGIYRSCCSCYVPLDITRWRYFPCCLRCGERVAWIWTAPENETTAEPAARA